MQHMLTVYQLQYYVSFGLYVGIYVCICMCIGPIERRPTS